jgi:ectoine hydroxylase-related dioxygenase (phytanoyl-CoA dioxygenase family)
MFRWQLLVEDQVELNAGDCLFFHSNLLHKSNANQRCA